MTISQVKHTINCTIILPEGKKISEGELRRLIDSYVSKALSLFQGPLSLTGNQEMYVVDIDRAKVKFKIEDK